METGNEYSRIWETRMNWIDVNDNLPKGVWNKNYQHLSEEVLVANSCSISIAVFDRNNGLWYVGEPIQQNWIDKVTHWMPLPRNPHDRDE